MGREGPRSAIRRNLDVLRERERGSRAAGQTRLKRLSFGLVRVWTGRRLASSDANLPADPLFVDATLWQALRGPYKVALDGAVKELLSSKLLPVVPHLP